MGWYYYLDDRMRFPFVARCIEARGISPLRTGETVTVTGMAAEDECEHEMFVQLRALDSARNDSVPVFGTPERTVAEIASSRRQGGLSL